MTKTNSGEGTVSFDLQPPGHSLSLSEVRVGTKRQELKHRPLRDTTHWLAPRAPAQGWHHTLSGLGPPVSVSSPLDVRHACRLL